MWQHAAEPSVRLPISMLSMNCSFCLRSSRLASIISSPAWAVKVMAWRSILMTFFIAVMSTMVPVDEAHGVSE